MRGFIRTREGSDGKSRYQAILKMGNGKRKSLGTYKYKKDAQARLQNAESDIANGTYGREELTLNEFYDRYIMAKEKQLKASSLRDLKDSFDLHILPALGDNMILDIGPMEVQGFVDSLDGKGLSSATIGKIFRYLRAGLRQAQNWQLIDRAPTTGIILPRTERKELDFLQPIEINGLLAVAYEPERTLFELLARSGLRLGEALALRWRDIDFDMNAIRVERSWSRAGGFHNPKSESSRRAVVLLPSLAASLKEYLETQEDTSPDNLLFSYSGKQPLDPGNTRREFYRALSSAKLRHVTIHSLRHSFASVMLASGANIKALQRQLGHATATMTLDVYSHLLDDSLNGLALKVDQIFTGAGGKLIDFKKHKKSYSGKK